MSIDRLTYDRVACSATYEVLTLLSGRWTGEVMAVLSAGRLRTSELRRELPGVSQRMLTRTLRGLERDGLVVRRVHDDVPPRVDYALSGLGESLWHTFGGLVRWSVGNHDAVAQAQRRFDSADSADAPEAPDSATLAGGLR